MQVLDEAAAGADDRPVAGNADAEIGVDDRQPVDLLAQVNVRNAGVLIGVLARDNRAVEVARREAEFGRCSPRKLRAESSGCCGVIRGPIAAVACEFITKFDGGR
jgi:hypothetical protein